MMLVPGSQGSAHRQVTGNTRDREMRKKGISTKRTERSGEMKIKKPTLFISSRRVAVSHVALSLIAFRMRPGALVPWHDDASSSSPLLRFPFECLHQPGVLDLLSELALVPW